MEDRKIPILYFLIEFRPSIVGSFMEIFQQQHLETVSTPIRKIFINKKNCKSVLSSFVFFWQIL